MNRVGSVSFEGINNIIISIQRKKEKRKMMYFMSRGFLWCGGFVREGLLQDRKWWVETLVVLIIPVVECIWEKVLK